jgi:hypothetical protein
MELRLSRELIDLIRAPRATTAMSKAQVQKTSVSTCKVAAEARGNVYDLDWTFTLGWPIVR